ncbi:FlgB family protein [Hyphococcus sp.]|uniref:FlgB family protein n=1 Tax=Hyphococcus sp. TaxID=2038636 RepID=UPI00208811A8|nr:MAG: flagellar biosynthesis protein FlgB [Marinicaulis sp.]
MFTDLKIMQTASALARHSVQRHAQIAENIANADTPGFKAKDLEPFSEAYARSQSPVMDSQRSGLSQQMFHAETITMEGVASPDGNTVSLEDQMTRSTAAVRDHDTALTVYAKTLSMLRATLGRRG